MAHAEFVHLHLHTEYSLLDGACRLDRLMDKAHELKFPAMAITDHGGMFGVIEFYRAALAKGIKPIIGCEVYVAPGSRLIKKSFRHWRSRLRHRQPRRLQQPHRHRPQTWIRRPSRSAID